jgi:hypothetical protein
VCESLQLPCNSLNPIFTFTMTPHSESQIYIVCKVIRVVARPGQTISRAQLS